MEELSTSPDNGELFGRYRLITKIATGGMGEIYLARLQGEGGFEKLLVIKRLLPELMASEEFRTMFVNEARITAQLSHPNICDLYELGEVDHQYFLSMQYLQGVSVSRIARNDGPVDIDHVRFVAGLIEQACAGLHHAHEMKDARGDSYRIVHRDVSPSNLFATFDGVVKVLDFGIATMQGVPRMTSKGAIRGKFTYMSPEQISGLSVQRTSDIFSAGIVMYEALTQQRMFERPSEFLIAKAILEDDYPLAHDVAPAVPVELSAVVTRALARKPEDRYQSAKHMADAIRAALEPAGGTMTPADIGERLRTQFAEDLATQRGQFDNATASFQRAINDGTESLAGPPPLASPALASPHGSTAATVSLAPVRVEAATVVDQRPRPRRRGAMIAVGFAAALLALALFVSLRGAGTGTSAVDAGVGAPDKHAATVAEGASGASDASGASVPSPRADPGPSVEVIPLDAAAKPSVKSPPRVRKRPDVKSRRRPPARSASSRAPGFLNVDSFPFATIYVDGKRIDVTPIPKLRLSPGPHRVRAVLKDGRHKSFKITIRSGKFTRKRLTGW